MMSKLPSRLRASQTRFWLLIRTPVFLARKSRRDIFRWVSFLAVPSDPRPRKSAGLPLAKQFGHIREITIALAVAKREAAKADKEAFLNQLIPGRELWITLVRCQTRRTAA